MILAKNFETNMLTRIFIDNIGAQIIPHEGMKNSWYKRSLSILREENPELFVLCPIYTSGDEKDFQIGITGTKDKDDISLIKTLRRECKEELGIDFDLTRGKSKLLNLRHKDRKFLLCIANINFFNAITRGGEDYNPVENPVYQEKIICFPIGTEKGMRKYLERTIFRAPNLTEHNYLKEVAAVPIWYLIKQGFV